MTNRVIEVHGVVVNIAQQQGDDYLCLTDIANAKEGNGRAADIIKNWLRNRGALEFTGTGEQLNQPNSKVVEFDHFQGVIPQICVTKQCGVAACTQLSEWGSPC
jgi:hypothetical protein